MTDCVLCAVVGQGPESEDLPARDVQRLESERALHGVRSLTKPPGLPPVQEQRLQVSPLPPIL